MDSQIEDRIAAVRRFNRFYTREIGVLGEGLLDSPFSLTEARILYELAHRPAVTATEIGRDLGLDAGYLSRLLRGLQRRGLIERTLSQSDRRQRQLRLTAAGCRAFAPLDAASRAQIGAMVEALPDPAQRELVAAMAGIEALLQRTPTATAYELRPPRAGDMGWIVSRHGALYAAEYGLDVRFEALVAEIVAAFVNRHDPERERAWIAERHGVPVGSAVLVGSGETAQLRLLIVEPAARGLGIGRHLVAECIGFARESGYRRITLWTQSVLIAARRIYEAAGFRLARSEPHNSFGRDLVGEYWEMAL